MRVAIHQPNYAPWCGYFAKMRHCDVFIFLDDVQMPGGQSYVYRCGVRGPDKVQWLSVPTRYQLGDPINAVGFANAQWPRKHLGTLRALYGRSPFFPEVFDWLETLYQEPGTTLAEFNMRLIQAIARYLELPCRFEISSALRPTGTGDDRLISLTQRVGGSVYVSGKGGQNYQDPDKFAGAGIALEVHEYKPVPYAATRDAATRGEFVPGLSILDALFQLGRDTVHLLEYPQVIAGSESSSITENGQENDQGQERPF